MGNLKDFATSTVAIAPSPAASGTSLVVDSADGARFPSTPFFCTVHPDNTFPTLDNAEKILVTNVSTDTFTITRAQGSTTAQSIAAGWRISNAVFAGDILNPANNLSDVASASTARTNLGLGSVATLSAIDLTANVTGILPAANGGTGSGFTEFTGPATSKKTFTLPNASSTIVVQGGALGTPSSATLTNATGLPIATGVSGLGTGVAAALGVNTGSAGAPVLLNGAGGTPSSLTLTNATGLPVSGITASTSAALGVGSIELGAASDTTLSRSAAGQLAVEGVDVLTTSNTKTLTNKTIDANGTGNSITNVASLSAKQQNNTSNSTVNGVRIETGWGVFAQGAATNKSEAVSFNTAFNSAPIVLISFNGDQTGGTIAYGNGGNTEKGPVAIKAYGVGTSGFTAHAHTSDGTSWSATANVYYTWIAIGN